MAVIGELATLITARTEPFTRGLKKASAEAAVFSTNLRTKMGSALESISNKITGFTTRIAKMGAAMTVGAVAGGMTWGAKLAMDYEKASLSFAVFLKSEAKAAELMKQIAEFAEKTPFSQSMIVEATQKLLSYGYRMEEMRDMWVQIGNVAALTGADMNTLAEILGRVRTQNRADLMDINRIADRAGQFYDALAKRLGVANDQVRELSRAGKISAEIFLGAFKDMTTGSGALAGGVEKLAETVAGKWSTLVDNVGASFRLAATEMFAGIDIKDLQDRITGMVKTYRGALVDASKAAVEVLLGGFELINNALSTLKQGKNLADSFYYFTKRNWYRAAEFLGEMGAGDPSLVRRKRLQAEADFLSAKAAGQAEYQEQYQRADAGGMMGYQRGYTGAAADVPKEETQKKQLQTMHDIWMAQDRMNQLMEERIRREAMNLYHKDNLLMP